MKRKIAIIISLICMLSVLTGCSKKEEDSLSLEKSEGNMILLCKDGTVQASIVEDFSKEYYVEEELRSYIDTMVEDYNKQAGYPAVEVNSIEVQSGIVKALFTYSGIKEYADLNKVELKEITVEELKNRKDAPASYLSGKEEISISKEEVYQNTDRKVVLVKEPIQVRIDGTLEYYTGATLLKKNTVQVNEGEEGVIIYKQ